MFSSLNDHHNHFICSLDSTAHLHALFVFLSENMQQKVIQKQLLVKPRDIRLFPSTVNQWLISKQSLIIINPISRTVK